MNKTILVALLLLGVGISSSCKKDERVGAISEVTKTDLEIVGNERCDVHENACTEEVIEIAVMHGPSYPKSYWDARHSEEYREATKRNFPNANSAFPHTVPGTDYAQQEGGKKFRRRYCTKCREEEEAWHVEWNKKPSTEKD